MTKHEEAMTKRERNLLALRFVEIEAELEALAEGRVVDGAPHEVEAALLDEQECIEIQLGEDWFDRRKHRGQGSRVDVLFG
jgi:hypothetical protein